MGDVSDGPKRVYRGATAQARQGRRRELLLAAAFDLIGTRGVAGLTVRSVTKQAGVGSRYFYESFTDGEDLVLAVYDWQLSHLLSRFAEVAAATPTDIGGRIRANVEVTADFFTEDHRRRAMLLELESTPALRERRRQMIRTVAETMVAQAETLLVGNSVPRERMLLRAHILAAGCTDLAIEWLRGSIDLTRRQFIDTVSAMMLSSVHDPVPEPP
ncbi:TetR/AcrR family transcriptional regulator [Nocardia arizonensis]|uniref:TetR/AcrR family transcriptional regulator n=1 Tax=Nocardia arizonensis TaxID=1141647 RepID=UPI0006D1812B|nr:TetR/AcrR family transcriptional regulator [Nocardia arizonensis]